MLFIDTHEASSIYPPPFAGGAVEDVGQGAGRGTTINIPMPRECRCGASLQIGCGRPGTTISIPVPRERRGDRVGGLAWWGHVLHGSVCPHTRR